MSQETSIDELLEHRNIKLDKSTFTTHDIIVIPNTRMSTDDIEIIKKLRVTDKKKVYVHDQDKIVFQEMRGGEFELGLFIVTNIVVPLLVTRLDNWMSKKYENWKERKNKMAGSNVQPPDFKLEIYNLDTKRHVKIEGDYDTALKVLKSLDDK